MPTKMPEMNPRKQAAKAALSLPANLGDLEVMHVTVEYCRGMGEPRYDVPDEDAKQALEDEADMEKAEEGGDDSEAEELPDGVRALTYEMSVAERARVKKAAQDAGYKHDADGIPHKM